MNKTYNYKSFSILYVDDEPLSLKYFKQGFEERFSVLLAQNAVEGLAVFQEHIDQIGIVITDQRMPAETGVAMLEKIREKRPKVVRILATAYADIEAAIAAVNTGAIYKYVTKPWDERDFEITLMRAMEFFIVQNERDELFREKISAFHRILMTDRLITLGILAAKVGLNFRNSLSAMKEFLALAPREFTQDEFIMVQQLRNPNYWIDFYRKVNSQLEGISFSGVKKRDYQTVSILDDSEVKLSDVIASSLEKVKASKVWERRHLELRTPAFEPNLKMNVSTSERMVDLLLNIISSSTSNAAHLAIALTVIRSETQNEVVRLAVPYPLLTPDAISLIFLSSANRSAINQDLATDLLEFYFLVYHNRGLITIQRSGFTLEFPTNMVPCSSRSDPEDFLRKVFEIEEMWQQQLLAE